MDKELYIEYKLNIGFLIKRGGGTGPMMSGNRLYKCNCTINGANSSRYYLKDER